MNYDGKKFKAAMVSENGEVSDDVVFHYKQDGAIVTCLYSGMSITKGHLLGLVNTQGIINLSYHQVNKVGELRTGECVSTPEILPNGKIRLHESWKWTSGDFSKGTSILEEI